VATYTVNKQGIAKARQLIDAHRYRVHEAGGLTSSHDAAEQNTFLKSHGWDDYASWHLALTHDATGTTARAAPAMARLCALVPAGSRPRPRVHDLVARLHSHGPASSVRPLESLEIVRPAALPWPG
jgi:hypothetical protein